MIGCKMPFSFIFRDFLRLYNQFSVIEDKETLLRLAFTYEPFWDLRNGVTLCKLCHEEYRIKSAKHKWAEGSHL